MQISHSTETIVLSKEIADYPKKIGISDSFVNVHLWDDVDVELYVNDSVLSLKLFGKSKAKIFCMDNSTLHIVQTGSSNSSVELFDYSVLNLCVAGNARSSLYAQDNSNTSALVSGSAILRVFKHTDSSYIKAEKASNGQIINL